MVKKSDVRQEVDKKCKSAKKTCRWSKKIKNVLEENQKKLVKKNQKDVLTVLINQKSGKTCRKVKKASAKPVKKASAKPVKKASAQKKNQKMS